MSRIEVFADVYCPFTHVGLRRLVERRAALGATGIAIVVRAWPLELVNGEPIAPDTATKEVAALRSQVAPDLFAGFDAARFPSTSMPAFSLAAAAYRVSSRVGEQVSLALRHALFEEGRDVADPAVLDAIAAAHRVEITDADRRSPQTDWDEGRRRGVVGSPHYFIPGTDAFCPGLHIEHVDDGLRIRADRAALDAFIERARRA